MVSKGALCKDSIFFIAEGDYFISEQSKRALLYGQSCFNDENEAFKFEVKMKTAGKIAITTMKELVRAFGCSLADAISNSASICRAIETQKNNRINLHQKSKNLKLEEFMVLKKLGEGQFGHVFLVSDGQK